MLVLSRSYAISAMWVASNKVVSGLVGHKLVHTEQSLGSSPRNNENNHHPSYCHRCNAAGVRPTEVTNKKSR